MDDMCKKEKVRQSKSETLPLHPSTYRARKCFLCENDELLLLLKNLAGRENLHLDQKYQGEGGHLLKVNVFGEMDSL